MIPLKLQIKNFLSYGAETQTIDFGCYPLICLSGKNGHGKSALLDALTWAIWGQARKLTGMAKADQGLLRLGQTQMMVCLDFECGGQQYRIRREFMQTYGKPVAILDFGLLDTTHDKFVSLTEKTIRDTQAKIEQTLHLTFDGFINSAFLRQGQANEFSKKTPKERKEVFASILGLDQYEKIRRLASERVKQITNHKNTITALNSKLEQDFAQTPVILEKLTLADQELDAINKQEQLLEHNKKKLEADIALLTQKEQKNSLLQYQLQQQYKEQTEFQKKIREIFFDWRQINRQQRAGIDYHHLEEIKKNYLTQIKNHQEALQQHLNYRHDLLAVKEELARFETQFKEKKTLEINEKKIAIERLLLQKNQLESSIAQVETAQLNTQNELKKYTDQWADLSKKNQFTARVDVSVYEKQFEKRKECYQRWIAQANMLSKDLQSLEQKNTMVHNEEAPSCPLCEQNLSASRKRFLKKKFEDDKETIKRTFARFTLIIKKLKQLLIDQHQELQHIKKEQQEQQIIAITMDQIQKVIEKYTNENRDAAATLIKQKELHLIVLATSTQEQHLLENLHQSHQQELINAPEHQQLVQKITTLETQLQLNTYNKSAHDQCTLNLANTEKQIAQNKEMQEQFLFQTQRVDQIRDLCKQLKYFKQQINHSLKQLDEYKDLETQQTILSQQKKENANSSKELVHKKEDFMHQKGSLQQQKLQLEQTKQEFDSQQKQVLIWEQTIDDYQAIAQATGKDGIQALLIEDAIPEIEQTANELLARLTDNQTQLFIESLRDLKKGGTKETLDIKISDSAGIRPYELFSGGEAFRIDFALRIAISKLLARRAGTSLQTLIIDEGFGSQDEDGLSHIMDAIYKIQDDFAKVIIVSHLTSMKNQFPVHFVIEKGPHGSIVEVMEQG